MPVFISTKHTASAECSRVKQVSCEKCRYQYFYELKREGTGTESSAYFLFQDLALDAAAEKAAQDGKRRLDSEADLVPCPNCSWINETSIAGYRKTLFRGWIEQAIWIAVIGLGICIGGVCVTWGIPNHELELFSFAVLLPTLLITFAGGVFFGIRWLRHRIQPNSNFPNPPRIPRNTPPALVLDPNSGRLIPVSKSSASK